MRAAAQTAALDRGPERPADNLSSTMAGDLLTDETLGLQLLAQVAQVQLLVVGEMGRLTMTKSILFGGLFR